MKRHIRIIDEAGDDAPPLDWEALFRSASGMLGKKIAPLTLVLVSTEKIALLNKRTRGKSEPTNVLSFTEDREIILAPAVAREEAVERDIDASAWMQRLVVHGILHLEGYTHGDPKETQEMEALERRILSQL